MADEITKIDENTLEVKNQVSRKVSKDGLIRKKALLEKSMLNCETQLAEVNNLLTQFE